MSTKVNLNADLGEGFGAYDIGSDMDMLRIIGSASVACGFHAGDANVMHRVVLRAKELGVSIGAHPGFNDLWGFGRRPIDMRADDLEYMVAYQIGALQAIAAYAGTKVTHLKAHGALSNMAALRADYALAVGRAIRTVDPSIIYVALGGSEMEKAAQDLGLRFASEAFVDRLYEDDGNLTSRRIAGAVITDPAVAAARAVRMVRDQVVIARSGAELPRRIDTLCVHGDERTGVLVAQATRDALAAAGIELVALPAMV
ncbi:MAG: 5-oxoprolinase subunit PxpA [Rhodospirillales bacterium]|nr:5-oxoprolinase subunit PxpA [Rhodospirillales bacterium]